MMRRVHSACVSATVALGVWSPLQTSCRDVHGKPTTAAKVRTSHSRSWWNKSKARHLTATPHDETAHRPHYRGYHEDVDRPMVMPKECSCFNCKKPIDQTTRLNYVWIPAGNATVPTKQGYFFHLNCFKCWKCKLRLIHNKFYSKDNQAWCLECALGRVRAIPTRRWHTSFVNADRTDSRKTGHFFPRHKHQLEFTYNPEE